MRDKEDIIDALKAIRKTICCYTGITCDCKFGLTQDNLTRHPGGLLISNNSSEQTGCPELYETIDILETMTEMEWKYLQERSLNFNGIR